MLLKEKNKNIFVGTQSEINKTKGLLGAA